MNQPIQTHNLLRFERVRVLVPGTGTRFRCGGLTVALQTARILSGLLTTEIVTYRERNSGCSFLEDLLVLPANDDRSLWLVSWGFDVPKLLKKLYCRQVIYQAHSTGYGFDLPPGIPIIAVSRNTLGYWADRAPRNPLFFLPNALEPHWMRPNDIAIARSRPIDVLVQARKSSPYVIKQLLPALKHEGLNICLLSDWVDDVVQLFRDSKVYIYDSAEYWRGRGVSEGFGLPPIEALASGCVVFTSFNHALADLLTPGITAHQIGCGNLKYDVSRIVASVNHPLEWSGDDHEINSILNEVSEQHLIDGWSSVIKQLELGFDFWHRNSDLLRTSPTVVLRKRHWIRRIKAKMKSILATIIGRSV